MHRAIIEAIEILITTFQTLKWTNAMNVNKKVLINHLLIAFQVGHSQVWKSRLGAREGSGTPTTGQQEVIVYEYPTDYWRTLVAEVYVKINWDDCVRIWPDEPYFFWGRGEKTAMPIHMHAHLTLYTL